MTIVEAVRATQWSAARALIEEYVDSLGVDLSFQGFDEEIAQFPGEYAPPAGAILVAFEGDEPSGVVALRPFEPGVCEMKRLYVRPRSRRTGLGRSLAEAFLAKAAAIGYRKIRLDTLPVMVPALSLYRALGFREIPAYRFNPLPGAQYFELEISPA